jgi:hypothetical protein
MLHASILLGLKWKERKLGPKWKERKLGPKWKGAHGPARQGEQGQGEGLELWTAPQHRYGLEAQHSRLPQKPQCNYVEIFLRNYMWE